MSKPRNINARPFTKGEAGILSRLAATEGPVDVDSVKRAARPFGLLRGYGTAFHRVVARLDNHGLIHCDRWPEGRRQVTSIRITPKGIRLLSNYNQPETETP